MATTAIDRIGKSATKAAEDPKRLAAAGVALAAIPLAAQGLTKVGAPKLAGKVSDLGDQVKDKLPDVGGDDDSEGRAAPGHGSGRRMPIQQAIDVAAPVSVAYDHWTRFEDWPEFMHRIENAEQVDDATVSFEAKIWGIRKRFEADIVEQKPDERIEWNVTEGYAHTGLVTFHALSDNLTRVDLTLDVQPSNLIDKASRGMRFVKRAVRGDLHRFKAYVELDHDKTKGWRGTIEDGKVKRRRSSSSSSRSRNGSKARSS